MLTDAPGEPKDVAIDKFDRSSVTLKWKPPNDDGGNPIKGITYLLSVHRAFISGSKAHKNNKKKPSYC